MRPRLFLFVTVVSISCNQSPDSGGSYRNAVLDRYFDLVDSSGKFDTTDISFKALKAYRYDDTAGLKLLERYVERQHTARSNWDLWQTDIPLPALDQLNVNEAYRFIFSVYDAPVFEAITVTKSDTVYRLHYLCYHHDRDSSLFDKRKEFERDISRNDWQEVELKLSAADYWGLISQDDHRSADGNDLTVTGYRKTGSKASSHYVHRWRITALNQAFYTVYYKLLSKDERLF